MMRKQFLLFVLLSLAPMLLCTPAVVFSQQRWQRTYGGAGDDAGLSVRQITDGGYIVAGYTNTYGNNYQVYLIKVNVSGDTLWTRTYGGANSDQGRSVRQTSDGGYIIAGVYDWNQSNPQVYLIKTNASGNTLWARTYGGFANDGGYSVRQTSDGGYIVAGYSLSFGNVVQVYLIKTDASGDTLWTRTCGGAGIDEGYSVQQTTDGGYIIAGQSTSFGGMNQVYLIKTSASGDTIWTRTFGGANEDFGFSVQQTSDSGYIVTGYFTTATNTKVYLIKTNASGDTLWTRIYGGTGYDGGRSVQQTTDGGHIVAGYTGSFGAGGSDVYLIKTNANGDTLWTKTYGGTGDDGACSIQQTSDTGYIVAGEATSSGYGTQVYLIKTDANGYVGTEENYGFDGGPRFQGVKITPNPFISYTRVPGHEAERFSIYDISGRKVGTYKGDRIGEGLSAGVYFLRPESGEARPLRIVKIR
jgi:hypothetical protein